MPFINRKFAADMYQWSRILGSISIFDYHVTAKDEIAMQLSIMTGSKTIFGDNLDNIS